MRHLVLLLLATACIPPPNEASVADYESQRERDSFLKATASKNVYKGLYENTAAIRKYCGKPTRVGESQPVTDEAVVLDEDPAIDDGETEFTWPPDCYGKLNKIFWSRLRINYKSTDWGEVGLWCDAYPDKCDKPRKIERLVELSNRKHALDEFDASQAEKLKRLEENLEFGDQDCIMQTFGLSQLTGSSTTTTDIYGSKGKYTSDAHGTSKTSSSGTLTSFTNTGAKCRTTTRE